LDISVAIDLEEVARHRLIIPGRPNTLRLILESAMAEKKLPLTLAFEGNAPHTVLGAVEAGLGFTALPFCSAYRLFGERRLSLAPIKNIEVSWSFIQARDQPLSTAGERMKAMLREIVAEQVSSGQWKLARVLP
jgi:LysR family transcriptional regulator, nitrogen assimilation regulatory protein